MGQVGAPLEGNSTSFVGRVQHAIAMCTILYFLSHGLHADFRRWPANEQERPKETKWDRLSANKYSVNTKQSVPNGDR